MTTTAYTLATTEDDSGTHPAELGAPPAEWTCFPWPVGWGTDAFSIAQVGLAAFPRRFLFVIRTPCMGAGAIVLDFAARPGSISLSGVRGEGVDMAAHLAEVIEAWPPVNWEQHAKCEIVQFLAEAHFGETEHVKAIEAEALPLLAAIGLTDDRNVTAREGHRYRLTPEHLEDVARVYREATADNRPPGLAVQHHFGVPYSTSAKWVGHARKRGLLPEATRGRHTRGDAR